MFDPITIIASLIPAITHVVTRTVDHFTGADAPQNVAEKTQLIAAENDKLRILAELDKSENLSPFVANIRALMRPVCVLIILTTWACLALALLINGRVDLLIPVVENLASSVMFYLFGERTVMHFTGRIK